MAACSHGSGYAPCPPRSVSKEFNDADAGSGILSGKSKKRRKKKKMMGALSNAMS
jgi:hypothetical protein